MNTICFFIFFSISNVNAMHDTTNYFESIELKDYCNHEGIIIPENYDLTWNKRIKKQYTPNREEIIIAEEVMLSVIKISTMGNSEYSMSVINKLRDYYRQYVGYIDKEGKKKILINMIKPEGLSKLKDKNYWKKTFLSMTNWSDKYRVFYVIDLENKIIDEGSCSISMFICDCYEN